MSLLNHLLKTHGKYYVWVYRKDLTDQKTIRTMIFYLRYITTRLPLSVVNIMCIILAPFVKYHAHLLTRIGKRISVKRSINEHRLSLYDLLTPKFVHRHTISEIKKWFKEVGFNAELIWQNRNGFGILGIR